MKTKIGQQLTSFTGTELMNMDLPEPEWLVKDLLSMGFFWFGGDPKIGKSYIMLQMLIAIASNDRKFLDRETKHGHCLYIALEDNPSRLKKRLKELDAPTNLDRLTFKTTWRPFNKGGTEDLLKELKSKKYIACIVDTYNRAFQMKNSNDTDEVSRYLGPLQDATKSGKLVIGFVDHHRKKGIYSGDIIQDVSGTISKVGVSDTVWAFYRKRGEKKATLEIASRDADEGIFKLQADGKFWKVADVVDKDTLQSMIVDCLKMNGKCTASDIASHLNKQLPNVTREISELLSKRVIERLPKEGREVPYCLARPVNVHDLLKGNNGRKPN